MAFGKARYRILNACSLHTSLTQRLRHKCIDPGWRDIDIFLPGKRRGVICRLLPLMDRFAFLENHQAIKD
ncbi:hypothetical protein [Collimonas humicola]|uniref:hypothetical protein n=1 Tax=Collimonas humicola TaxID=2825886 RepID=UPI001B8C2791|nr:hypothetical protein [Collimonas humicola]